MASHSSQLGRIISNNEQLYLPVYAFLNYDSRVFELFVAAHCLTDVTNCQLKETAYNALSQKPLRLGVLQEIVRIIHIGAEVNSETDYFEHRRAAKAS